MIIFKTHKDTLDNVISYCKHALEAEPKLYIGEIILIAQTKDSLNVSEKPIRYVMEFVRSYEDIRNESDSIWGKHWHYMIEGKNCRQLKKPFDISDIQISSKNYGQGGPFVHVDKEDEEMLRKNGYLD